MSPQMKRRILPFTAIVGQEKLKQALILNAINHSLLGVLIRGEKGTGKSTAVRALADLLPEIDVLRCPFNCSPYNPSLQCEMCSNGHKEGREFQIVHRKMKVVELPLGATEDRVTGSLDIEKALSQGVKALEPGILAEANQGILYIDEVNLLDDHLVDILLDSAAMGVNTIERESISVSHPSRFILVGTMNPEEGELRPQLLDRFGLSVEIKGTKQPNERIQIIKTVEQFESNPEALFAKYAKAQTELSRRILKARELLNDVHIFGDLLEIIANICIAFEVHGHRADFLIARTAKTMAAYSQRKHVIPEDIKNAAELVLPHRMRRLPFEEPKPVTQRVEEIIQQHKIPPIDNRYVESDSEDSEETSSDDDESHIRRLDNRQKFTDRLGIKPSKKINFKSRKDRKRRAGSGRRAQTLTTHSGKYVKAKIPEGKTSDIAIDATIRASIARSGNLKINKQDLREKVRAKKVSSVIVFVVDASGSMSEMREMQMAKESIMALLEDSYQKRDKVAFIAVRGEKATVLLQPTSSVEVAAKLLKQLPVEGRTPLSDGLFKALQILEAQLWKNKNIVPIMIIVSDGRGNIPIVNDAKREAIAIAREIKKQEINLVVIDSDDGFLNLGYNREIAEEGGGSYYRLNELDSHNVVDIVKALSMFDENTNTAVF